MIQSWHGWYEWLIGFLAASCHHPYKYVIYLVLYRS
jgi:hypothetical protein